jgi:signal transduction histidine kinase
MTTKPADLRAESFAELGTAIQRDAGVIIQRWSRRAAEEQPSAARSHHAELLDHLPVFLWELGRSLGEPGEANGFRHTRPAWEHGDQRWDAGWSLSEVVRDYQLLRIVLVEYLEETLDRPLRSREVMALGVTLDDAIGASVAAFVKSRVEQITAAQPPDPPPPDPGKVRDDFLAVLGHELRNPLAPIRTALEVMAAAAADPARVGWAHEVIDRQTAVMSRLVDDLLDASRVARGKVALRRDRVDLARVVRDAAEDRRPALATARIALTVAVPADPVWTTGDAARLAQVVGNLLSNAQKFTDPGGTVAVRLTVDPARREATLAVRDTGVGIDPEFLAKVFGAYMQADRSVERSRGGLGLGLALVKGLVELHGGEVRAASNGPGTGAEFTVVLPLLEVPPEPAAGPPKAPPAAAGKRVLVIDDNVDTGDSLRVLLGLAGHAVAVARTGPDGVSAAKTFRPDVVLCDLGLPGLSGYAVCTALRKDPATAGALIVALSGHGSEADKQQCAAAGFDLHLLKPVEPEHLQQVIATARRPG